MFDFETERKEKYYKRAEKLLAAAGIDCVKVDRARFGVAKDREAKVHLVPWNRRNVTRDELRTLKEIPGFQIVNDRYTKRKPGVPAPLNENGFFSFPLDECDR